jgi:hypothetical protein
MDESDAATAHHDGGSVETSRLQTDISKLLS